MTLMESAPGKTPRTTAGLPIPLAENRFTARELDGARILCECLIAEGVEVIFGYPGGVLLPLYHVLSEYPEIRHILVRHEQAGGPRCRWLMPAPRVGSAYVWGPAALAQPI